MTVQEIAKIVNEKYSAEYSEFLNVMVNDINIESAKFCNPEVTVKDIEGTTTLKAFYALIAVFEK